MTGSSEHLPTCPVVRTDWRYFWGPKTCLCPPPQPSEWSSRRHSDPYCATHCSPGGKHSQCGCPCDHRSIDRGQGHA